jgi:hypothetical protein
MGGFWVFIINETYMKKYILIIEFFLFFIFFNTCVKQDVPITNNNTTSTYIDESKKHKRPILPPDTVKNLITFYWDNVGTYPAVIWTVNPTDYNTPVLSNTLGTPNISTIVNGSDGWHANCGYSNNLNTISTSIERYAGHPSLHIILNPFSPTIPQGMDDTQVIGGQGAANCRSEIALYPWHYLYKVPSEIWLSWSYYFPTLNSVFDPYIDPNYPTTDNSAEGLIHQLQAGDGSPVVQIWYHASWGNEMVISGLYGDANNPQEWYLGTKYPFVVGKWMDFIEHVQWSTESDGLYELWCIVNGDSTKLCTHNGANTFSNPEDGNPPYGGTPKLGIYHWFWHSDTAMQANESLKAMYPQTQLEEYLGEVRFMYNLSGKYNNNGYKLVKP